MNKIDFKKELSELYRPPKRFTYVDVPAMNFLMLDGKGDPNTSKEYKQAIEALYALAYRIKFKSKAEKDHDYVVPPLEGLWWADDMASFTDDLDKNSWYWTMMIMQPDWISPRMVADALFDVSKKKDLASLTKIKLKEFKEGLCVQIMYIGSYDQEGPTIRTMHVEHIVGNNYIPNGKHHEIYLSDPRKSAPDKLKTIIRQPIISV